MNLFTVIPAQNKKSPIMGLDRFDTIIETFEVIHAPSGCSVSGDFAHLTRLEAQVWRDMLTSELPAAAIVQIDPLDPHGWQLLDAYKSQVASLKERFSNMRYTSNAWALHINVGSKPNAFAVKGFGFVGKGSSNWAAYKDWCEKVGDCFTGIVAPVEKRQPKAPTSVKKGSTSSAVVSVGVEQRAKPKGIVKAEVGK